MTNRQDNPRRYVAYSAMRKGWCIYQDDKNGVTATMIHGPFLNEEAARSAYRTFFGESHASPDQ